MRNITQVNTTKCTGCRACEQICPLGCITMANNEEGFLIPKVDEHKCNGCGQCLKICNMDPWLTYDKEIMQEVYAVKNNDKCILKSSSSGGVFYTLASYIIKQGGVVYGCAFSCDLIAEHIEVNDMNDVFKLQGSKYVQSDTSNTFKLAKDKLNDGLRVLYVGTACQIKGLKSFLKKEYDNLITVDIICHGVPSPLLFHYYIQWLSKKYKGRVFNYNFRSKQRGWGLTCEFIVNDKKKFGDALLDPYYKAFLDQKAYRECCYSCEYATNKRISDITLGDYWGVDKEHPQFFSAEGVSAVLLNTKVSKEIFNQIKDKFEIVESSFEKVANRNSNLLKPSDRPEVRTNIYKYLNSMSFDLFAKKYLVPELQITRRVKLLVPSFIRRRVKQIKLRLKKTFVR